MDPSGVTSHLCEWIAEIKLADVPESIRTRVKYLFLDGLACGLHGAHLQWSELAVRGVLDMEGEGWCGLLGWQEV